MQDRKPNNRFSLPLLAIAAGVILAAGGGAAWWAKHSLDRTNRTIAPKVPATEQTQPTTSEPIAQEKVEICWLDPQDNSIELVASTQAFQKSIRPQEALTAAFETLLAGPQSNSSYTTSIPEGTKLLGLNVDKQGVRVNLSREFVSGGGSASMEGRLAQVIYTATSTSSSDRVFISVEGKPLKTLGGEGLLVAQPMTRESFEANFQL
ncbi:GerMN domain-containing protein [Myxosarcina sp. GI1]|uniref:GerMN domain-containing protein n=1 Tax=Myxosarcina sp. GI1 TaxID=1541065 RepID=UPI00055D0733|nr:GerMN domain-containing protein [Myxosarcina sp. GI1]